MGVLRRNGKLACGCDSLPEDAPDWSRPTEMTFLEEVVDHMVASRANTEREAYLGVFRYSHPVVVSSVFGAAIVVSYDCEMIASLRHELHLDQGTASSIQHTQGAMGTRAILTFRTRPISRRNQRLVDRFAEQLVKLHDLAYEMPRGFSDWVTTRQGAVPAHTRNQRGPSPT